MPKLQDAETTLTFDSPCYKKEHVTGMLLALVESLPQPQRTDAIGAIAAHQDYVKKTFAEIAEQADTLAMYLGSLIRGDK